MQTNKPFEIDTDTAILATGYTASHPDFLSPIKQDLIEDENQFFKLNKNFSMQTKKDMEDKIFVQNNSLFSHGIGSADLGLGCYRNAVILNTITGTNAFSLYEKNVFQSFDVPDFWGNRADGV